MSLRAALALAVVLPLAVGLPLRRQLHYYDTHRARQAVTVVPPGGTGYYDHAAWRLRSIRPTRDGVRVHMDETALDDAGTVQIVGTEFLLVDATGRTWAADLGPGTESETPRELAHMSFDAELPSDVAGQVEFVIRPAPVKRPPRPLPELRFRR